MNKLDFLSQNWLAKKINNQCLIKNLDTINGCVVDLGCGTSPYKENILKVAKEYIGVDWENSLHDQSNVDIFADLTKPLPIEDEYADTVVSFQVMEHLSEPNIFLREAFRILKKGGKILITVPFQWHINEEPHDYYRYTKNGLDHLFNEANFINIDIRANTGFWSTIVLKFNYHTARYVRGPKFIRFFLITLLLPIWIIGQIIAPILDKFDPNELETASYTVVAEKP